jgi:hypothetical protein
MNYKPDEKDWMAYLYGELSEDEKAKFDQYLLTNKDAADELRKFHGLRGLMASVEDKEVIAPPLVLGNTRQRFWDTPYLKTILSIAASLLIVMLIGRLTGMQMSMQGNEFKLSFRTPKQVVQPIQPQALTETQTALTAEQVQQMINKSLVSNNTEIEESWKQNEEKLTASISKNLANNSNKIDQLVRQASSASQDQIRDYVSTMQNENMQMVKDYFQLTSTDQKKYIEGLLVDFSQYLQQQRNNDLQLVDTRLKSLEQNTDIFKQETEQILSSIISTVGGGRSREIKN